LAAKAREIRNYANAGCEVTLTAHAREEMKADGVSLVDVMHVLRSGVVRRPPDRDVRSPASGNGASRARVTGVTCCVVVVIEVHPIRLRVVTVWEDKRR